MNDGRHRGVADGHAAGGVEEEGDLAGDGAASLPGNLGAKEQQQDSGDEGGAKDDEDPLSPRRDLGPAAPENEAHERDEAGRDQGAPEERQNRADGEMDGQGRQGAGSPGSRRVGALLLESPLRQGALEEKRGWAYTRRLPRAGEVGFNRRGRPPRRVNCARREQQRNNRGKQQHRISSKEPQK